MKKGRGITLDLSELEAVSIGSPQFRIKMIQIYIEDFGDYLSVLRDAWKAKNRAEVLRISHKMKSPAGLVKVQQIDELLKELESTQDEDFTPSNDCVLRLSQTYNEVKQILETKVKALNEHEV